MYLIGFPLLLIPFALYNIVAFVFRSGFGDTLPAVVLPSGVTWAATTGDLVVGLAILLVLVEILKAARLGRKSIIDHFLSLVLLFAMIGEFLLVPAAATSTFLILIALGVVDVVAGFALAGRVAASDIGFDVGKS
jgi:hypothetical protein